MTQVELLAITAPFFAAVVMGLFLLVTNYFDNRAAAKELKQKQADALRPTTHLRASLSDLSEAEREQLKLHIETLEAFAETVKNAGAVVEESSRRVHLSAAAQRSLEDEKR
jgi:glucan phosphoethanolaminetransferase (alkaline phosphatase superfamily)